MRVLPVLQLSSLRPSHPVVPWTYVDPVELASLLALVWGQAAASAAAAVVHLRLVQYDMEV
jgi:hypothetical protein